MLRRSRDDCNTMEIDHSSNLQRWQYGLAPSSLRRTDPTFIAKIAFHTNESVTDAPCTCRHSPASPSSPRALGIAYYYTFVARRRASAEGSAQPELLSSALPAPWLPLYARLPPPQPQRGWCHDPQGEGVPLPPPHASLSHHLPSLQLWVWVWR